MKKSFFLLFFVLVLFSSCEKGGLDMENGGYRVKSAGSLGTGLNQTQKDTITTLKLYGKLNAADFQTMRDEMPKLAYLDLTNATIEGNTIPDYAFSTPSSDPLALSIPQGKASLINVQMPKGITAIGIQAFCTCTGLTGSLVIPDKVTDIGNGAFSLCTGFTGLILGNSITSIGDGAFMHCTGFTGTLTIPKSVTSIEVYAFYNCTGFADIKVSWATPIDYTDSMLPSGKTVHVPSASLSRYQAANGWKSHPLIGY